MKFSEHTDAQLTQLVRQQFNIHTDLQAMLTELVGRQQLKILAILKQLAPPAEPAIVERLISQSCTFDQFLTLIKGTDNGN